MKELLWVMAVDPGGYTGVQAAIVPLVDGRLRFSAVESLNRSRALAMTFGAEITDTRWQDHVNLISQSLLKSKDWLRGKIAEIGYSSFRTVLIVEGWSGGEAVLAGDPWSPIKISAALEWSLEGVVDEFRSPLPAKKGQITDPRLKAWTWFAPGKRHLNDARRHLLVYLRELEASSVSSL